MPAFDSVNLTMTALSLLFTALGLSSSSGLRAYLPLLAVALGSDIQMSDGAPLVHLSPGFETLHAPWVIAVLVALTVAEFLVDKIPLLDHASDAVHTVIRPLAGAVIMAGTTNPLSDRNIYLAAVVGGLLALSVHGAKAATRPVVTASTLGAGNPVVSLTEDMIGLVLTLLSLLAPFLAVLLLLIILVLIARPLARGLRLLLSGQRPRPSKARQASADRPAGGSRL
jgi:hypothetical protein